MRVLLVEDEPYMADAIRDGGEPSIIATVAGAGTASTLNQRPGPKEGTVDRARGLRMPRLSLARLTPRRLLHLPSRTVRLRLTLLYGGLFLVSGVALLAIMWLGSRWRS